MFLCDGCYVLYVEDFYSKKKMNVEDSFAYKVGNYYHKNIIG
jgi:hypothetical protein